jgi:hypothetical protein
MFGESRSLVRHLGRRPVAYAVALFLLVRGLSWGAAWWLATDATRFDAESYLANFHHGALDGRLSGEPRFFELGSYSDAEWYLSIADHGYPSRREVAHMRDPPGGRHAYHSTDDDSVLRYAFFPLFPALIALVHILMPLRTAAFVVVFLCGLGGAVCFVRLMGILFPDRPQDGLAAYALLLVFPFSVFYGLYFTESLFLLLSLLTFEALFTKRFALMGLAAALLALTRPNGIFVVVPLVFGVLFPSHPGVTRAAASSRGMGRLAGLAGAMGAPLGLGSSRCTTSCGSETRWPSPTSRVPGDTRTRRSSATSSTTSPGAAPTSSSSRRTSSTARRSTTCSYGPRAWSSCSAGCTARCLAR